MQQEGSRLVKYSWALGDRDFVLRAESDRGINGRRAEEGLGHIKLTLSAGEKLCWETIEGGVNQTNFSVFPEGRSQTFDGQKEKYSMVAWELNTFSQQRT